MGEILLRHIDAPSSDPSDSMAQIDGGMGIVIQMVNSRDQLDFIRANACTS